MSRPSFRGGAYGGAGSDAMSVSGVMDGGGGAASAEAMELSRFGAAATGDVGLPPVTGIPATDDESLRSAIGKMMEDLRNPEFQQVLGGSVRELTTGIGIPSAPAEIDRAANSSSAAAAAGLFGALATNNGTEGADNLARTLEIMQRLGLESKLGGDEAPGEEHTSGEGAKAMEAVSEDVITRMMEEFERLGAKDDFDSIVENMMKQILAKEIMYIPMRQITERFPHWLGHNKSRLAPQQYEMYGKMYQVFQHMVMVYETEPSNFGKLAALMQEMQEYGMPPGDLIKEVAPGIELSPDGTPMIGNIAPGMPPLPVGGAAGDGVPACTIM